MRVLLDESVPRQLAPLLHSHSVSTVPREGWEGLDNGELLDRAVQRFDVLVTGDQVSSTSRTCRDANSAWS